MALVKVFPSGKTGQAAAGEHNHHLRAPWIPFRSRLQKPATASCPQDPPHLQRCPCQACLLAVPRGQLRGLCISHGAADISLSTTRASCADPILEEFAVPECNERPWSWPQKRAIPPHMWVPWSCCGDRPICITQGPQAIRCLCLEFHSQDIGHIWEVQVSPWSLGKLGELLREQLQFDMHYGLWVLQTRVYEYLPSGVFTPEFWSHTKIWEQFEIQKPPPKKTKSHSKKHKNPASTNIPLLWREGGVV